MDFESQELLVLILSFTPTWASVSESVELGIMPHMTASFSLTTRFVGYHRESFAFIRGGQYIHNMYNKPIEKTGRECLF